MSEDFPPLKDVFIQKLDEAIEACYDARMENSGAVLTLNIKDLYIEMQKQKKEEDENSSRNSS